MSSRLQRSSISPFRSRKTSSAPGSKPGARPTTPSTGGVRPTTPTYSSTSRQTTPSSSASLAAPVRGPGSSRISPVSGSNSSFSYPGIEQPEFHKSEENVTVTVRFRPLSPREISKGDEIAWYADGDFNVRNEYNPSIAYGFDRVFGPATTTRHVYDVAAQHVVSGAMQGINGTVFAYGVTSSGKTHTMHGEQKSPGIIPLAIKDVFSIIQETPGREFLLRVSYLEIYNEVINDLLDPVGQNLRIREDSQGTYVEGIKEEVVLSPAHALSLIASGEEHRHVGSNNFNLLSSRSHTIFTLTIESSPSDENSPDEDVTLSQLNLIDLAGSESSKAETTGLRRKEGSYINKSLLTLGTVISKLTDDKATHIPYRDSKLTRLLQSSLSGHGRVSLICTVTPASSNSEETHNTLKFAHRSKHVEIKASQNKIMDEKSLIKKYQREISCLKEELQQLKCGMMEKHSFYDQEDIVNLKLQLEAGQVKLLSKLEEEEQAKAALMGRIQRLTKLILVSTKSSLPSKVTDKSGHRRRHSFGEDELAYLPDRKREYIIDDDVASVDSELSGESRFGFNGHEESLKFEKKNRKRGMFGWLKIKKPDYLDGLSPNADDESSASGSPLQVPQQKICSDKTDGQRISVSRKDVDISLLHYFPEKTQAGDLFCATSRGQQPPPAGTTLMDEMDLLSEQIKMLAGEVALCTSSLKRLAEQAANNPEDSNIQEQMQKLGDEINEKKQLLHCLEQRMVGSREDAPHSSNSTKTTQNLSTLATQLSEKAFELEIMSADNRILQDQLQIKISDNAKLEETIKTLNEELNYFIGKTKENEHSVCNNTLVNSSENEVRGISLLTESSSMGLLSISTNEESKGSGSELLLRSQVLTQAAEIENLKQRSLRLAEEKDGLQIHCQKLAEEASYARELAAAAADELRNLAEEVTKLSYENAKLTDDLAASMETATRVSNSQRRVLIDGKDTDDYFKKSDDCVLVEELRKELSRRCERESSQEAALSVRDQREGKLKKIIDDSKQTEQELENELTRMRVLVAKLKRNGMVSDECFPEWLDEPKFHSLRNGSSITIGCSRARFNGESFSDCLYEDQVTSFEEMRSALEYERRRCKELEGIISKLKGEELSGLDVKSLEEMQNCHVEALSKICQEKLINQSLLNQEDETAN
ncbi:kinesin-like protein KIN-7E, chloroplastic [Phalaenopsis equestris]|uniref:kinesin-like protein KIN-7E, chloroplastic n=1 Tax=Phalaenopsis equestris TaxID=78828 RepID=UPI0009E44CAF|nr:kinesin-like protein KIN-7E, chloroplastic [Phalaenopsis equestris]